MVTRTDSAPVSVQVRETVDARTWDDFVERHPLGTIYHSSPWQRVIQQTYGYLPLFFFLEDSEGAIVGAIPSLYVQSWLTGKRIVAYPFSDSCDPLVANSGELNTLLASLEQTRSHMKAAFYELRLQTPGLLGASPYTPHYFNYHLSLSPPLDDIFRSFHKNCIQRPIKAAEKGEVETRVSTSDSDLKVFYRLHTQTRRRQGVPVQPFRFFRNLLATLVPHDMLRLFLAHHRGKCVAAIVVLRCGKRAYYKYGASDKASMPLKANQLIMWEAIRWAKQAGCNCFDFGRTSSSNEGLNQYKSRWGTERIPLQYLQCPDSRKTKALDESSVQHAFITAMMTRLPAIMIRLIGEVSYKHFA
jgi:CelD/BcsL family acetyltransferase involved in cellulose biosynthesis